MWRVAVKPPHPDRHAVVESARRAVTLAIPVWSPLNVTVATRGLDRKVTPMSAPDELVQLLSQDGQRVEHPDYPLYVSPDEAMSLYRDLVMMRRFDTEATALQRQGELGLFTPILGQEAAQIGAGRAMRAGDMAFTTYREHGIAWCRGIEPLTLLGLFRGVTNGGWNPHEHGMALYSIVIGDHVPHAVGYGMGIQRDGTDDVVLAFFGDGATSEGDVHEAFVFASVFHSPVLFFLQNNGWAISEPVTRQTRVPLVKRADGYGIPRVRIDGNDVLASLAVTRACLQRIREGSGPILIEAVTYRMGSHTTSDDPTRYRSDADLDEWRARDPLMRVRRWLQREEWCDDSDFASIEGEADSMAAALRSGCVTMANPEPLSMFDHVYASAHQQVTDDRAFLARYLQASTDVTVEVAP